MNSKAKTGRTTRMLLDALQLCSGGRAVYVIAANERERIKLNMQIEALGRGPWERDEKAFVKVETVQSVGNLNWETITLRGAHPNCVVLVDHYAIETHFSRIFDMLTQYDLSVTGEDK